MFRFMQWLYEIHLLLDSRNTKWFAGIVTLIMLSGRSHVFHFQFVPILGGYFKLGFS